VVNSQLISKTVETEVMDGPTATELRRRMAGPQRYRLLQGYPMPPLMRGYDRSRPYAPIRPDTGRKLIVGVLPHASCAPSVKGCGYCTFPHESFHRTRVEQTVAAVNEEIRASMHRGRSVEALYFGGGTANLTPPASFQRLLETVSNTFDLSGAEITLEGAPAFFLTQQQSLLGLLEHGVESRSKRLSMGVQTFDVEMLAKMGRLSLGHPTQVAGAVKTAHRRGMTTSADLMINLPGQSLGQMLADVERAAAVGFDQICVYHLVLFRGLGTPWSRDREMLGSVPDNQRAFENWRAVVERVKELGFVQKTVTNFERRGCYRYENDSYRPQDYDALGFGPAAISCFTDLETQTAVKWINESNNLSYREAVAKDGSAHERLFVYGQTDLKLLYLTRTLAGLSSDRVAYRQCFGSDPLGDFANELEASRGEGLLTVVPDAVELTEKGNFFADSVTGLLARQRVSEIRNSLDDPNSSGKIHMG
jgi:coproporphyrinogen III oxidase-like Fe-S oxidoreductase